jgi:hypothetical protein
LSKQRARRPLHSPFAGEKKERAEFPWRSKLQEISGGTTLSRAQARTQNSWSSQRKGAKVEAFGFRNSSKSGKKECASSGEHNSHRIGGEKRSGPLVSTSRKEQEKCIEGGDREPLDLF